MGNLIDMISVFKYQVSEAYKALVSVACVSDLKGPKEIKAQTDAKVLYSKPAALTSCVVWYSGII